QALTRCLRAIGLATPVATILAFGTWADEISTFKAGAHRLSAPEIMKLMIGNTLGGKSKSGDEWFEYYDPNGTARGISAADGKYSGEWWLDGDKFCTKYPSFNWQECDIVLFNPSANKVLLLKPDGSSTSGTAPQVIVGDPQGL